MGLAEVGFSLSARATEVGIHGTEAKMKRSRNRRPKPPCIAAIIAFCCNLNKLLCPLLSSSYWATSLTSCLLLAVGASSIHHLIAGFAKGMQISQVPCAHQDAQGSQEPRDTLGPSVASEIFTRGLGESMQVSPLDQTQPLT